MKNRLPKMALPAVLVAGLATGLTTPGQATAESSMSSLGSLGSLFGTPTPPQTAKPAPTPTPAPVPTPPAVTKPTPNPPANNVRTNVQINDLTNQHRKANGTAPLTYNYTIERDAQRWADYLAATGDFFHDPELGTTYRYVYAENIYRIRGTRLTANHAMQGWLNSPGHRANMLNPGYSLSGIGIAQGKNGSWIVVARYADATTFQKYHPNPGR